MQLLLLIIMMCFFHINGEIKLPYKIKGPKSFNDKIAIVGAGPSGVHMAYLLKQKGFKNVHILERSSRVGGKAYTVYHRNTPLDVGAIIFKSKTYIQELAKKFLPDEILRKSPDTFSFDGKEMQLETFFVYYAKNVLGGSYKSMDDENIIKELRKALERYDKLIEHIFGKSKYLILPKPKNLELINGTLHEFLVRNNLTILVPYFIFTTQQYSYGFMHHISAFYGIAMEGKYAGKTKETFTFKCGFQKLWQVIVDKERLNVQFNAKIHKVYRDYDRKQVWLKLSQNNNQDRWEHFDFLIWSPNMRSSMSRWMNHDERELLSGTFTLPFTISIADSKNEQHGFTPWVIYPNNTRKENKGKVQVIIDEYSLNHDYYGQKYKSSQYPTGDDKKAVTTYIVYQNMRKGSELNHILSKHFQKMSASGVKVVFSKTWDYFPRYSVADIKKGVIWKIMEMQGKYGMWYIGSSVYFETSNHVVAYNTFIVENMEPVA